MLQHDEHGGMLGILYAEDFDDEPAPEIQCVPAAETEAQNVVDTDVACAEAVQAARVEWEVSQQGRRTQALSAIAATLADARSVLQSETDEVLEAAAKTILSMIAGVLPDFCKAHGDTEVRSIARLLLPTLRRERQVTIRVHSGLVEELRRDILLLEDELAGAITIVPAPLPPGDIRVVWTDGSFARDTGQILAAIQEALAQLGLMDPVTTRRMAHA